MNSEPSLLTPSAFSICARTLTAPLLESVQATTMSPLRSCVAADRLWSPVIVVLTVRWDPSFAKLMACSLSCSSALGVSCDLQAHPDEHTVSALTLFALRTRIVLLARRLFPRRRRAARSSFRRRLLPALSLGCAKGAGGSRVACSHARDHHCASCVAPVNAARHALPPGEDGRLSRRWKVGGWMASDLRLVAIRRRLTGISGRGRRRYWFR
jgi:hypothetical protein